MPNYILVPLDGSMQAERALPLSVVMARLTSSGITLLQAVHPPAAVESTGETAAFEGGLQEEYGEEERAAGEYLHSVGKRLCAKGLTVEVEIVPGKAATGIVQYADINTKVWLIAMATSHWGSRYFGSVAEKVMQTAFKPILLIPPKEIAEASPIEPTLRTIIVPLDGSAFAEHALEQATQIALRSSARVALVCASAPSNNMGLEDVGAMRVSADVARDFQATGLRRYLAETAEHLRAGGVEVLTELVYGHPAEMILLAASRLGGDLIVMAAHRRRDPERLWLGSVAQRLVQDSTLPVLLLRAQPPASGEGSLEYNREVARR